MPHNMNQSEMPGAFYSVITGSGRYIPKRIVTNQQFLENEFYNASGEKFLKSNEDVIDKF